MNSQNIKINYKTKVVDLRKSENEASILAFEDNTLISSPTKSLYSGVKMDTIIELPGETFKNVKDSLSEILFKDLIEKTIFSKKFGPKKMIVKEESYAVNWKIIDNYKTILGYKTQEAKGSFRGRNYSVFFCPDLPYRTGPYKFDGLPGVILEVVSDDNKVNIKAYSINLNSKEKIENPYAGYPTVSWKEYNKRFNAFADRFRRAMEDEGGSSANITNKSIELTE
jgi:GLPGLI family protein